MEADYSRLDSSPGTSSLGELATKYPGRFGKSILTTNFDPLVEISIRRSGGTYLRTTLHADGNLSQTEGDGVHVIHLHGLWFGSDTLHTSQQLGQARPALELHLVGCCEIVGRRVCIWRMGRCFHGSNDGLRPDDAACPEILWTFYSPTPILSEQLGERLGPGINRGRVTLYQGIDCHKFFHGYIKSGKNWSRNTRSSCHAVKSSTCS